MSVFFNIPREQYLLEDEHFFVIHDKFPVSPGHCLIISKALRLDYFHLNPEEKAALPIMIDRTKQAIEENHTPQGFNIGMNCGQVAGQTVMHFHCHIIPRYPGDMDNPAGGVRGVIPEKQKYGGDPMPSGGGTPPTRFYIRLF